MKFGFFKTNVSANELKLMRKTVLDSKLYKSKKLTSCLVYLKSLIKFAYWVFIDVIVPWVLITLGNRSVGVLPPRS